MEVLHTNNKKMFFCEKTIKINSHEHIKKINNLIRYLYNNLTIYILIVIYTIYTQYIVIYIVTYIIFGSLYF